MTTTKTELKKSNRNRKEIQKHMTRKGVTHIVWPFMPHISVDLLIKHYMKNVNLNGN